LAMSCRRICRELLWLARFGELGPSSAPHLDHLVHCGHCRDEVGFDRALVQQLRSALAQRIEHADPSPAAWGAILERAQVPERSIRAFLRDQATAMAARLRTATAISAIALAGIIATSTHVAITHPEAGSAETEVVRNAAGEQFERQALIPRPREIPSRVPVIYVPASAPSDPEAAFLVNASLTSISVAPAEVDVVEVAPEPEDTTIRSSVSLGGASSRLTPLDPMGGDAQSAGAGDAVTADPAAGEPY
ncbi:MAG: hypothetical protein ACRDE6_01510, partial [Candidatus Limnocylindria bacterium]